MNQKILWNIIMVIILLGLVGLAVVSNLFLNQIPQILIIALSLGIAANVLTWVVHWVVIKLSLRFANSHQAAKSILRDIYKELEGIDKLQQKTGRFRFGYEHVIYSPKIKKMVDDYVSRFEKHLIGSSVDDTAPYESAILALFAGYNPNVADCLKRKFHDVSLPEFSRMADKAGNNILFQRIVLTLALGEYFPGCATTMVERMYKVNHRIYYGDWISQARNNFEKVALYASSDEFIITFHIGNAYKPLDIFSKLDNKMKRIDFYFIHPYILSRQGLMALSAELDAPDIIKKEVGFIHTSNRNYQIDYVRKIFQILSNVHEITEFALKSSDQNVHIYFFAREIPSVCVQIVRDMGYLFVMLAAFDNAKFLCRFTLEIRDKEITEEFVQRIDTDKSYKERILNDKSSEEIDDRRKQRFLGAIEKFAISRTNLQTLCEEAIQELIIFLRTNKIGENDMNQINTELMMKLPADVKFIKKLYNMLLESYHSNQE